MLYYFDMNTCIVTAVSGVSTASTNIITGCNLYNICLLDKQHYKDALDIKYLLWIAHQPRTFR